ncbi:hypothetical protein J6590_083127 [Homalodisca vitripennis]|nr:hypothetical protein J6590_083127 [Homalodisca vitripennis]
MSHWSEDKSFLGLLRSGELFQLVLRSDARAAPPDFDLLSDLSHHRWQSKRSLPQFISLDNLSFLSSDCNEKVEND